MDISVGSAFVPTERNSTAIRISQIVKVLRRHALFISVATLGAAAGGFFYATTVPKTYTASSAITVEGEGFAIPVLQGALRTENSPDPMPWVRTEVQALTSRDLVSVVIAKMGLDHIPEFNPALRPPTLMDTVKDKIKDFLPQAHTTGPEGGPNEAVLNAVEKSLAIFQDNRSLVIATAFTSEDPRLAANFLNTLIADYIKSRADRRAQANRGANDLLTDRIKEVRGSLDQIEQQMRDLRSRGDIVALRAGTVGQQQVEELATAAARASVDRSQLEANWNRAAALAKQGSSDALAGVLDSPTISRLRDQESTASAKMAELSSHYGPNYPGVRSAAAELQSVRAQLGGEVNRIVASLGTQLKAARDKEADLQQQLAVARTAGVKGENAREQLDQLQKEADTRRALYQTLLQSAQQTVAQPANTQIPDVRVLSVAAPPGNPSGPNTKIIMGLSGLSGAVLSSLLALLRLRTVDGFNDAADLTRATGLPAVGSIRRKLLQRGLANRVLTNPRGPEAEVLRAIRGRLRFAGRNAAPRCVLFASALGGGKGQELAAALARTAALDGEHVLLIEGNVGAPSLDRLFGVKSNGLADVLKGQSDWRDVVVADPRSPLDLLLLNRRSADAQALLTRVPLQNLLVEARQQYDLVVLSGPMASAADAAALALRSDVTVIGVDAQNGNPAVQDAIARLGGRTGSALTGLLVG